MLMGYTIHNTHPPFEWILSRIEMVCELICADSMVFAIVYFFQRVVGRICSREQDTKTHRAATDSGIAVVVAVVPAMRP